MNIFISGLIDRNAVTSVVNQVIQCPEDEPIIVYINSWGGNDNYDYAIYEALRLSERKIITYAVQEIYSAAVVVFLAGEERYAHRFSSFMIHEPYHDESEEDARKTLALYRSGIKDLADTTNQYFQFIADHTKLTTQFIEQKVKNARNGDWYFDTNEAMNLGLVTHVGLPVEPTAVEWHFEFEPEAEAGDNSD